MAVIRRNAERAMRDVGKRWSTERCSGVVAVDAEEVVHVPTATILPPSFSPSGSWVGILRAFLPRKRVVRDYAAAVEAVRTRSTEADVTRIARREISDVTSTLLGRTDFYLLDGRVCRFWLLPWQMFRLRFLLRR